MGDNSMRAGHLGRPRDHLRGRRGERGPGGHLPARGFHERRHRHLLLPVRRDHVRGRHAVAPRGDHADARCAPRALSVSGSGPPGSAGPWNGPSRPPRPATGGVLAVALGHRWAVVLGALVFFAASFFSVKYLNKEFLPAQDMGLFIVQLRRRSDLRWTITNGESGGREVSPAAAGGAAGHFSPSAASPAGR